MSSRWFIAIVVSFFLHIPFAVYFVINKPKTIDDLATTTGALEMRLSDFKSQPVTDAPVKSDTSTPDKPVPITQEKPKIKPPVQEQKIAKVAAVEADKPKTEKPKMVTPSVIDVSVNTNKEATLFDSTHAKEESDAAKEIPLVQATKAPEKIASAADIATPANSTPSAKTDAQFTDDGLLIMTKPIYLKRDKPIYPWLATSRNQEGQVVIDATLSEQGNVIDIVLYQSSGFKLLDRSAQKAVKSWKFEPARRSGIEVMSVVRIAVDFNLEDG